MLETWKILWKFKVVSTKKLSNPLKKHFSYQNESEFVFILPAFFVHYFDFLVINKFRTLKIKFHCRGHNVRKLKVSSHLTCAISCRKSGRIWRKEESKMQHSEFEGKTVLLRCSQARWRRSNDEVLVQVERAVLLSKEAYTLWQPTKDSWRNYRSRKCTWLCERRSWWRQWKSPSFLNEREGERDKRCKISLFWSWKGFEPPALYLK